MHDATKIEITRAEGPSALCGNLQTFEGADCWARAQAWLSRQSHTFPAEGGYDKHDFSVTFADGYVYEGRLDCQHRATSHPDLDVAAHVLSFLTFYAGIRCPSHLTPERYRAFLARDPETVAECREALERCVIPGAADVRWS